MAATFHAVCARLLREHAQLFGRTEHYTIYEQGDMRRVLDWILADKDRVAVQEASARAGSTIAEIQRALSTAKNELLSPTTIRTRSRYLAAELIGTVWEESERELTRSNAWDFEDLLTFGLRMLCEPHIVFGGSAHVALAVRRRVPGREPRAGRIGLPTRRPRR
jgi:DNA helicase-2/ATP-dependent DNA helicase PcrA